MDSPRWRGSACVAVALVLLAGGAMPAPARGGDVPAAALERRVGHAFRLDTGQPVYREIHEPVVENGRLAGDRVTYRAPDGALIARKRIDFSHHPLAPSFRLEDFRTGYVEGLERGADGVPVLFHREGTGATLRRASIPDSPDLVADAGFDLLIYRRIEALAAGRRLTFPFAAPSRLDTVAVRLRPLGRRTVMGEPALLIRMEADNVIVRWLADAVDVAYHAHTGALLRYEGVSNIPDPERDGNYRMRIDFPPPGAGPQPPPPEPAGG